MRVLFPISPFRVYATVLLEEIETNVSNLGTRFATLCISKFQNQTHNVNIYGNFEMSTYVSAMLRLHFQVIIYQENNLQRVQDINGISYLYKTTLFHFRPPSNLYTIIISGPILLAIIFHIIYNGYGYFLIFY